MEKDCKGLVPLRNDGPIYCQQVVVQTKAEAEMRREIRKEQKRAKKELNRIQHAFGDEEKLELELAQREILRMRQLEMDQLKWTPTLKSANRPREIYPYVFDACIDNGTAMITINGMKYALPEGSTRESFRTHEEVEVPPMNRGSIGDVQHVFVKDMDDLGRLGFQGFEKLNVIQSIVFEQAYKTKENLLICAPTGAGKTNIAMLTILNTIHEHRMLNGEIAKDDFKIIYIAPMKALATEMTDSFGKRLAPLGLKVRELTGDTTLTKKEVAETQMLVLTPEKWDVVTRKGASDTSLTSLVRLLIIDEVHLLHDDRGPVIETIVARTLRQVEMSQTGIRIVGLSATLPNYVDVARFLRVNPYKGLFYFDGRFRPVPLTQKFIGVKKTGGVRDVQETMNEVCYDEVLNYVKKGHQVLVFVHARNATASLAQAFRERAAQLGHLELFLPQSAGTRGYVTAEKSIQASRNHKLFEFFRFGLGVHHAGLVRHDRLLMEKTFHQGHIMVLFCTATLAWGVNLPAHAVVIRGTEVFDAEKGQFTDLGVLDVQQIFGRAGRPQFENEGHGIIITTQNKLDKYLGMLIRQAPIESQFFKRIHDNMNAEIALGTVSNIDEAVEWLTYTYYYTRATQNPIAYGLPHMILDKDPDLRHHLTRMVTDVAVKLDQNQMIRFDSVWVSKFFYEILVDKNAFVHATDLGRIASNFYIKYETIEMLNETGLPVSLSAFMPDDMVREEECLDLEELISCGCVLPLRGGGLASVAGKVNVLLQSHISRTFVRSFSLASESLYVQQNASRLCRAIFEIVLRKGWAQAANAFLTMSKAIERRVWPNQSSLRQLDEFLRVDLIEKVERRKLTESQLLDLSAKELGYMFSCDGEKLYHTMRMLPRVEVDAVLKPITYTIMQVSATLTPAFVWNDRLLGKNGAQSFWLTLENIDENLIVHQERIAINKKKVRLGETQNLIFTIPIRDHQLTNVFQLRVASEYFLVDDTVVALSMHNCILPKSYKAHTDLLPLDPLPVKTIRNEKFESIYNFSYFNPIQTQVFHCLYQTDENVLIGAPTGSGKTLCAELAMFRLLQRNPGKKCVYIAPLKALVRERVSDWREKFERKMGYKVVEVSGDYTPDVATLNAAPIMITTPEKWDGITRSWATREYVRQVNLVIIDEIHLLGVDRGAVLEAIITRLKLLTRRSCVRESPARLLGLSTALANAGDVAEWLGIRDEGLFNFRPSVRPVPIDVHIQGFPGQHYCPRMALMNKPAFKAIISYSPLKPVLVFVASRRQTRITAMAFISHLVTESDPRQWLHIDMAELEILLQSVKDENLKLTLPFGIGMHHAGLTPHERALVEELYVEKKIQVLIATATLAWGINMPAHLVIVKGTEYYDGKTCKYVDFPVTDVLQMMGRAGRPQYDTSAVAVIYVQDVKKTFYKRFLYEPFPVESSLLPVLPNHVNAEINAGTITSKQGIMEYLAGTYLYRRLFANPNYYGLEDLSETSLIKFLVAVVDQCVADLLASNCIIIDEEMGTLRSSPYGRIASIYYLRHETMKFLLEELGPEDTIEDLLKTLSHVPEYDEIPVRHNEDVINTQLQRKLRIRFATSVMDSSHTKAHLLFQAMRDICQLNGWLSTALRITILQQMCHSGRWHDDHPLLCLPHLKTYDAERIGDRTTIPLMQDQFGVEKAPGSDVVEKRAKNVLLESTTLDEMEIREVIRALCRWPILSIGALRLSKGTTDFRVDDDWIQLEHNRHYRLHFHISMLGPNRFNTEAYLTQWSKEKTAGWIVIIGEKDTDRLISISHLSAVQGDRSARVDFVTPDKRGRCYLTVFIMSDCYLGIDQELQIKAELL
ncbi:DEAD/DEAH box helicase [Ancylostoma ceylanicum]|uniref:DEAD/DEAH box helicase n=1 Tax=Ancylostoma ceylanicum TaxID=53326 RepID=A0A0D6M4A7_9BILA|nr:DEAD/DEAH box helicase [Ancylostoma ceylanicum]